MIFSAYVFFCFSKVDASFAVLFLSQKNIDLFSVSGNILSSVSVGIVNKFALKEKETSWCAVAFPCGMSGVFLTQPVCLESLQSDDVVGCLVASVTAFCLEEHVLFISWFGEMKALRTLSSRDLLFFLFRTSLNAGSGLSASSGSCTATGCQLVQLRDIALLWLPKQSQIKVTIVVVFHNQRTKVVDIKLSLISGDYFKY